MIKPRFFATPARWRQWLEAHHASRAELWVGLHKKDSGKPSITWPESVDQALCYGWIDGIRKSINATAYMIRFTPRRPGSIWSLVNTRRARALIAQGLMRAAGRRVFEDRRDDRSGVYSFEQRHGARLPPAYMKSLRANPVAWRFFRAQPPGYQRTVISWVISAKREETRRKRLGVLIQDSAQGLRIGPLRRPEKGGGRA
jgi:uncharacterized protein YdeI (YjbR/CyaY-like superfamily)